MQATESFGVPGAMVHQSPPANEAAPAIEPGVQAGVGTPEPAVTANSEPPNLLWAPDSDFFVAEAGLPVDAGPTADAGPPTELELPAIASKALK